MRRTISVRRFRGTIIFLSNWTGEFIWWYEIAKLPGLIRDLKL